MSVTLTPERVRLTKDLTALFEPKSIAVIGASRRPEAVGYAVMKNLISGGFTGNLYPVNPKADTIENLKSYASLLDIPDTIDLAILVVPSTTVPQLIRDCGQKGVKAVIIISAGFREIGEAGVALEKEVIDEANRQNLPILGPNCLGLINTDDNFSMNASFGRTMPKRGNIAFISQSGALCTAILDYAKGQNMGFSKFISLGNKCDLSEVHLLQYLKDDPHTDVILMYIEDLQDGWTFIQEAREITGDAKNKKPIITIKSGRTQQGAKAAASHTGSLMGSDAVYDAIFAQAGVLRADSVSEMFDLAKIFAYEPVIQGDCVAIVTNAGGPGIMATDACIRSGLSMASFHKNTTEQLKKVLPPASNISNPVDVIGDARNDRYRDAMRIAISDSNVDALVVILTPQAMTDIEDIAKAVVDAERSTNKPVVACFMGISDVSKGVDYLEEHHIPHYPFPEDTARALAAMNRYRLWTKRPRTRVKKFKVDSEKAKRMIEYAHREKITHVGTYLAMDILKAYKFPVLPYGFAGSGKEAIKVARQVGFPAVMKIVSEEIVHKFDVGGIRLNIQNVKEAKKAYDHMMRTVKKKEPKAHIKGVMLQKMADKGREVILGMNRDQQFGPILMFGLGGVYVEAFKDVTFRLAPIRELGAERMIKAIRAYPLLKGIRGEAPADLKMIEECLERLSQLACEHPLIQEIDINPLMVYSDKSGAHVVDARIVLKK